ncbi:MAG: tRNA pseudouridine(55) synthase TruB [Devosia nanyangense]|uniref:tRNA pseudouridine synthase B n=1 Tax=Devosia nanyangense TaxID=1228055 RepID=A0A933P046_9HYPH|nr:tRNA pseudouridine(55) synthase TruB [Devosia nanyangense]
MPKSPKRPVSGWIILDKPYGMTSTQAVGKVRWLFSAEKAGHAGTLDPLATGLLPIALGEATKTVPFVQGGGKRYRFTLKWGEATATEDAEGEVIATSDVRPSEDEVRAMLPRFTGTIQQRPPAFSAIKVNGERAYDLARAGETVELAERPVTISELTLLAHGPDHSEFEMACEKGTYVRALARDLAEALGTRGHVVALRRTAVAGFTEKDAVLLETLEAAADRDGLLRPAADALRHLPELRITPDDAALIRNGGAVLLRGGGAPIALAEAWASLSGQAVAIGEVRSGSFHPSRVLKG